MVSDPRWIRCSLYSAPWGKRRQAPAPDPAEPSPASVVGTDGAQLGGTLPGRVHEAGGGASQRAGEGTGPAHVGMVGVPRVTHETGAEGPDQDR